MKIPKAIRRFGRPIKRLLRAGPLRSGAAGEKRVRLAVLTDRKFLADRDSRNFSKIDVQLKRFPAYLLNRIMLSPRFPSRPDIILHESLTGVDDCRRLEGYDCIIVHIDKSVRPALVNAILERLPPRILVTNRQMTDIRKKQMNEIIGRFGFPLPEVRRDAGADTPVFVKSNWNVVDAPEKIYRQCRLGEVTDEVWRNPDMTVQRFFEEIVEETGGCRRIRRFVVAAGEIVQGELFSKKLNIKGRTMMFGQYSRDIRCMPRDLELLGRQNLKQMGFYYYDDEKTREISQRMQKLAADTGLDIGAIDTVTSDGATYALDVNTTPYQRQMPEAIRDIFAGALLRQIEENRQGGKSESRRGKTMKPLIHTDKRRFFDP